MAVATEISTAISSPITGETIDEDDLQKELNELEEEVLDERLRGAERVPVHTPTHIKEGPTSESFTAVVSIKTIWLIHHVLFQPPDSKPWKTKKRRNFGLYRQS